MDLNEKADAFHELLEGFKPEEFVAERVLSFFSAAVTVADRNLLVETLNLGKQYQVAPSWYYEIILQSYLFLGFPRMLIAAEFFDREFPDFTRPGHIGPITFEETNRWCDEGLALCRRIYARNYELLKKRVERLAPDIFRWMIIEGYGKVLSRPQLDIKIRELSIVVMLMIENREKQLYSHLRGALNVGVTLPLLRTVIEEIGYAAGDGYLSAQKMLKQLGGLR